MKTAISPATWQAYATFKKRKHKFEDFVEDAAKAEYAGVEISGGKKALGKPTKCRRVVESHDLMIAAYQSTVTYSQDPISAEAFRADVEYAAEIGIANMAVKGGFLANPRRNTYPADYDTFATNLGKAIEFARKQGVTVCFHPYRGSIVETIAETKELLKRLPKMRICVDIAHLEASGEDALKFIRAFKKQITHTHVKDYTWKLDGFVELGRGDGKLNVAKCVKELKRAGYNEWLTVELDKTFAGVNPRTPIESAKMCRRYLRRNCSV